MEAGVYPYFREITSKQGTEVEMEGHKVLMFGSNAYTGLPGDQRIIDAAKAALDKYGSGCAGSRFLNGTLDLHVKLERQLAEFEHKDDALCFSTGFFVNSGVLAVICGREDYIICDERDHASIVDGRRLSFAKQLKFKHNDMEDLEKQLQKCEPNAVKLIVVDGVFSMEGDLANLPEIVRLKHKYNASIMADEIILDFLMRLISLWVRSARAWQVLVALWLLMQIPSISCVIVVVRTSSAHQILQRLLLQRWKPCILSAQNQSEWRSCGRSPIML